MIGTLTNNRKHVLLDHQLSEFVSFLRSLPERCFLKKVTQIQVHHMKEIWEKQAGKESRFSHSWVPQICHMELSRTYLASKYE